MNSNIGGKLQGISLEAFLQMAQMEQITCTLQVASGNRKGVLFLQEGNLISAEANGMPPLDSARNVISWEKTVIDITESCSKTVDEIKQPLMNILMDAMQLRDEIDSDPDAAQPETEEPISTEEPAPEQSGSDQEKADAGPDTPEKQPPPPKKTPKTVIKAPTYTPISDEPKRFPLKYIIVVLVLAVAGAGLTLYFLSASKRSRLAYENLVQTVEFTEGTAEKLAVLNAYIRENRDGEYVPEAKRMIDNLLPRITALEFELIEESASSHISGGDIEGAITIYENFLKKAEKGHSRDKASLALKNLLTQIEASDFEEMQRVAMAQGPERISTYQAFLEKHPESSRRQEILGLISEMEAEYFIFLQRRTQDNEAPDNLAETIELGRKFIETYPGSDHIEAVNRMLDNCQNRFLATLSFGQLQTRANAFGTDYESARIVYEDYLKAYPGSPVREKIDVEIDRLTELAENARLDEAATQISRSLSESGDRFKIENNETALDKRTGLMWCLLDSQTVVGKCMTHENAASYVADLETGGHTDWRLPTPEELSTLYGKAPTFPSDPEAWYWSSETEKRYVGQWNINVAVFLPGRPEGQRLAEKESWQCGAVRAVRRP